jgi:hypothetical protein
MSAGVFRASWSLVAVSLALPAWSQVSAGPSVGPDGAGARSGPEPYVAEFTITTVKPLANGTTLTQKFTEVQAWDVHGRTMTAITNVPASSDENPTTKVRVSDPVTRISSSWDSNGKVATVIKRPLFEPGRAPCSLTTPESVPTGSTANVQPSGEDSQVVSGPTGVTARVSAVSESVQSSVHLNASTTIERLGTETILGIETHGSRITQTTLAGAIGNPQPMVSIRESWQANVHGVGLTLREVDDDPQNGKRTTELVNFSLGEPDPASFQPPKGYEISTLEMHQVSCQQPVEPPQ